MKHINNDAIRYMVTTSAWGSGIAKTMEEALKEAGVNSIYALNTKTKRFETAVVKRIELDESAILTEKVRSSLEEQGVDTSDLELGDYVEPWINGLSIGYVGRGELETVICFKYRAY